MRRVRGPTLILLTLLTVAATGYAQSGEGSVVDQPLTVDDELVVPAGRTLVLGPNASAEGEGRIIVHGTLRILGDPEQPVPIGVPILVEPGAFVEATGAAFDGPGEVLVRVRGGTLDVRGSTFAGGEDAILVAPDAEGARLRLTETAFAGHSVSAVSTYAPVELLVERVDVQRANMGIHVLLDARGGSDVVIRDSAFDANLQHVLVRLTEYPPEGTRVHLEGNTFRKAQADPEEEHLLRGLRVTSDAVPRSDAPQLAVTSIANEFVENHVGLELYGRTFRFDSTADVFRANDVAVKAYLTEATFTGATFQENTQDVDSRQDTDLTFEDSVSPPSSVHRGRQVDLTVDGTRVAFQRTALVAAGSAGIGGLLALGAVFLTETGRRLVLTPLFSRMAPGEVLAHEKRKDIVDFVRENPGVHMRQIGKELGISYSTLTYHVHRLEKEGYVTSHETGLFKRYYLTAGRVKEQAKGKPLVTSLRPMERRIYDAISANPGCAQSELADRLGMSRQALHYHVKKLEKNGFVRKIMEGRETLCYASGDDALDANDGGPEAERASS